MAGGDENWVDFEPGLPGVHWAHWPEPCTLFVYLGGLDARDRAAFVAGAQPWFDQLRHVRAEFLAGEAPIALSADRRRFVVQVRCVDGDAGPEGELSLTELAAREEVITGPCTIRIARRVLGRADCREMLRNLATHEVGHVLGLEDARAFQEPVPPAYVRRRAMDPNFARGDPHLPPTEADVGELGRHYTLVSEPASVALISAGLPPNTEYAGWAARALAARLVPPAR